MMITYHWLYFPITKVGERRHNYVGAPDNRIQGSFRTCPNAPGTRHKPGTWTRGRTLTKIYIADSSRH